MLCAFFIAPFTYYCSGDGMPYLWIDGVYGRDTNAAQGNSDSSILVLNPKTQTTPYLGIRSGSIPQKIIMM
jgi:hypothetical protein